ncbi:DUF3159 domain-containing protein [Microbacterium sp. ASV49]|uniref:DUF3159 domain-containing protein n=1 Tax=Microbacterium candidum TaxID=3041922 RepID=A0ABT7MZ40_9MICO|nr:DUF3159 domain-containing protein [Microbacterium sp. ASV49]MDL9979715.1 DUF3159 domain-containing protein [Microbacterium sp. ASV49]
MTDRESGEAAGEEPRDAEPSASDLIGAALGNAARRAGLDPAKQSSTGHVVWAAMGGWRGILESVLPTLVFVVVWGLTLDAKGQGNLLLSIGLSVGLAAVFTLIRLATHSQATAAIGGLIAAAAAAALALWTGNAANNFLLGLITNAVYGLAFLVSAIVRWPLIGLAAGWLMGEGTAWREDARKRRVYFWLTIAWAALFFVRLAVELPLYIAQDTGTLGIAKLVLGLPLFAPLVAVTWLAVRALYPKAPDAGGDAPAK